MSNEIRAVAKFAYGVGLGMVLGAAIIAADRGNTLTANIYGVLLLIGAGAVLIIVGQPTEKP